MIDTFILPYSDSMKSCVVVVISQYCLETFFT